MAVNTTPIFIKSALTTPVSFSTTNTDLTGASGSFTTVVTAGSDGAKVDGISFMATGLVINTYIYIWHNTGGTRRLVGWVKVDAQDSGPNNEHPPWSGLWINPDKGPLASGDKFDVAAYSGSAVYHARALGGSLTA